MLEPSATSFSGATAGLAHFRDSTLSWPREKVPRFTLTRRIYAVSSHRETARSQKSRRSMRACWAGCACGGVGKNVIGTGPRRAGLYVYAVSRQAVLCSRGLRFRVRSSHKGDLTDLIEVSESVHARYNIGHTEVMKPGAVNRLETCQSGIMDQRPLTVRVHTNSHCTVLYSYVFVLVFATLSSILLDSTHPL
jgi:hypothetical protein